MCIKDTVLSNNITNENEKIYKLFQSQLQELLSKEEIINNYILNSTIELKQDIKKLQQEKNICENELQTIYEKRLLYMKMTMMNGLNKTNCI